MEIDKSWNRAWLTQDNTIHKGPCFLGMICATPKSNKRTDVLIYDSQGSASNEIMDIGTDIGVTNTVNFTPPLFCSNGIYLNLDGDTLGVLVVYKPVYSEIIEK